MKYNVTALIGSVLEITDRTGKKTLVSIWSWSEEEGDANGAELVLYGHRTKDYVDNIIPLFWDNIPDLNFKGETELNRGVKIKIKKTKSKNPISLY